MKKVKTISKTKTIEQFFIKSLKKSLLKPMFITFIFYYMDLISALFVNINQIIQLNN